MPSLKITTPLLGGKYYHIYNRGVNRLQIFFTDSDFKLFLILLTKYLLPHCEILSYCLLVNHFHLVVYIADECNVKGKPTNDDGLIGKLFSAQFRKMMIAYSVTINKQQSRCGSLFGSRFKRIEICDDDYLKYLIFYCHFNPQKHGYCSDYTTYKYSSYQAIISNQNSKVSKSHVIVLYGGIKEFKDYHRVIHQERQSAILED